MSVVRPAKRRVVFRILRAWGRKRHALMRPLKVLALAGLLIAGPGHAAEAPSPPASIERAALKRLKKAGATPEAIAAAGGLFRPVRLSGSSRPDWIVDYGAAPTMRMCGTGGCRLQVWAPASGGGYRLVFDRQVLAHEVADGPPRLILDVHGVYCGGTGSDACREIRIWKRGRLDLAGPPGAPSPP